MFFFFFSSQNVGLFLSLSDKVFDLLNPYSKTKTSKSSLRLPILVRHVGEQHCLAPAFDCVLGEVYTLDSEMSSNNWTILGDKYLIGPLPSSSTFILSVGQRSRRFDCQGLTSLTCVSKGNNLFSLSNCALDPPSYTFSLLSLISQIVALKHLDSNGYRGHTDLATKLWVSGVNCFRFKLRALFLTVSFPTYYFSESYRAPCWK